MKDYSKYIPSSYGFITKYEIVGKEIHVYTVEIKDGEEPHKYPLTADWLRYIEKRLENQYQLVKENRDIIRANSLEPKKKMINKVGNKGALISLLVSIILLFLSGNVLDASMGFISFIASFAASVTLFFGKDAVVDALYKKFDEEMDIIEAYLENREDIEQLSLWDKNITAHLSKKSQKMLDSNKNLKIEEEPIDNTRFNIHFLDKSSLKELRKLLSRYMISKGLLEEQKFVDPTNGEIKGVQEPTPKRRVLIPENHPTNIEQTEN